jgi:alcohol dehydrogenase class IV
MVVKLQLPPTLIIGGGASQQAVAEARRIGIQRPLLVVDPYLLDSVPATSLAAALPTAIFSGVTPDPDLDVVAQGLAALHAHRADGVVALGGGSAIDAAKAIAILATNPGPLAEYMGYHKIPKPGLPLIAIPSTAGTGSEATRITIITDRPRNVKMMILDGHLLPTVALVDYELSLSMPAPLTAAVGIDSLTHALEAYVSRKASPFSDAIALEAGQLIAGHLLRAYQNPADLAAKEAMMTGATLGGMAFSNASVALVHGMSRPLGAFFHIPHGLSNAMLLPAITRFSLPGHPSRYAAFAAHTGLGTDILAALEAFNQQLNVPTLREYGVPEAEYLAAIPQMADDALASGSPANNPRIPTKDEIVTLYHEVYG